MYHIGKPCLDRTNTFLYAVNNHHDNDHKIVNWIGINRRPGISLSGRGFAASGQPIRSRASGRFR